MVIPEELRGEAAGFVVRYVFDVFRRRKDTPSVLKICRAVEKEFRLERVTPPDLIGREKGLFPGGVGEIYEKAGIPESLAEKRLARTRRATEGRTRKAGKKTARGPGAGKARPIKPSDSALEDEEVRGLVEERRKEEKERHLVLRKVEERRMIREARRETLMAKAILDSRKIPEYLLFTKPQLARRLEAFCKDEGTTLKAVCRKRSEENPFRWEGDFDSYVEDLLHDLDFRCRKAEIRKQYGEPWDARCRCGLPLEYRTEKERDKKGKKGHYHTSFICPQGHEHPPYFCPFCRELDKREVHMAYDVKSQVMRCPACKEFWMVEKLVHPEGTYLSGEKPLSIQEQRDAAAFVEWAKKQPGGLHDTFWRFVKYRWSLREMGEELAGLERHCRSLGDEISSLKEERAGLRGEVADLRRRKEGLEKQIGNLGADLLTLIGAKPIADSEKQKRPYDEIFEKLMKESGLEPVEKMIEGLLQKKEK